MSPVSGCPDSERFAVNPSTPCTQCAKCDSTKAVSSPLANSGNTIGDCSAPVSPAIPNCDQHWDDPSGPTIKCARCADTHVLKNNELECDQVANCKTKYNYDDSGTVKCKVATTNFIVQSDTSIVQVPSAQEGNSHCKGYSSLTSVFAVDKSRCAGCPTGYVLDTSSDTKYDCVQCSAGSLIECSLAIALNGQCLCGRCTTPGSGFQYIKHPKETGCFK